jgi:hypothetical protein
MRALIGMQGFSAAAESARKLSVSCWPLEHMVYGGNHLDKARGIFEDHRQAHFTCPLDVGDARYCRAAA